MSVWVLVINRAFWLVDQNQYIYSQTNRQANTSNLAEIEADQQLPATTRITDGRKFKYAVDLCRIQSTYSAYK